MKVSFDGARKNLAQHYNALVNKFMEAEHGIPLPEKSSLAAAIMDLRTDVAGFLCMYDDEMVANDNDGHDLSDIADGLLIGGEE